LAARVGWNGRSRAGQAGAWTSTPVGRMPAPSPRAPARARSAREAQSKETGRNFAENFGKRIRELFWRLSSHDRGTKTQAKSKARAQPPPQAPRAREESRDQSQSLSSYPNRRALNPRGKLDDRDGPRKLICEACAKPPACSPSNRRSARPGTGPLSRVAEREGVRCRSIADRLADHQGRDREGATSQPARWAGSSVEIALEHARSLAPSRSVQPYHRPAGALRSTPIPSASAPCASA
jgi:hypothetical protein